MAAVFNGRQRHRWRICKKGPRIMLKFIGGTIGLIFLIGLVVVVLFFKLLF